MAGDGDAVEAVQLAMLARSATHGQVLVGVLGGVRVDDSSSGLLHLSWAGLFAAGNKVLVEATPRPRVLAAPHP